MNRFLPHLVFTVILSMMFVTSGSATTYYIAANGSDSNSGTSQSAAWAHAPGMRTWAGSRTPAAGDSFILRGCDVWGNANFPITWTWGGTSSNRIAIDVDRAWYNTTNCPSGWNRPIFDGGNTELNPPATCGAPHFFLVLTGTTYTTFNSIEARNFYWAMGNGSCWAGEGYILSQDADYIMVNDWYFHKWTHNLAAGTTDIGGLIITQVNTTPACQHCVIQYSVMDNIDGDGANCATSNSMCSGGGVMQWSMRNNICANLVECWYGPTWGTSTIEVSGNNMYNINMSFTTPTQSGAQHPNCIESTGVVTGTVTMWIHDNWIHNIQTCEGLQVGNGPNEIDFVWNNIWDMGASASGGANGPQIPQNGGQPGGSTIYFYNNTVRWAACANLWYSGSWRFTAKNNHCINDSSTTFAGNMPSGAVTSNNLGMTNATATSQGYTTGDIFAPTSSTNSTVGQGVNLTSSWPNGASVNDSTQACKEQTSSGVAQSVCPQRVSSARPSSGAWDIGAYLWGTASALNPPSGLTATVQ